MKAWHDIAAEFAAYARSQEFVVGDIRAPYSTIMQAATHVVSFDPDPARRQCAAMRAAAMAGNLIFNYFAETGLLVPGDGSTETPAGREAERHVIATSGLSVLYGDESFLAVAQAALGFSASMQSRGWLTSVVGPPLVRYKGELVLGSALPALNDILERDHPAARLLELAADRRALCTIQRPQIRGGHRVLSLDGQVDAETIEMPVISEVVAGLTVQDWAWVEQELRMTGRRQDLRDADALAVYMATGGSRARMGNAAYMRIMRAVRKPSRLGWLIRKRAAC